MSKAVGFQAVLLLLGYYDKIIINKNKRAKRGGKARAAGKAEESA
jgi:hypothetical protein